MPTGTISNSKLGLGGRNPALFGSRDKRSISSNVDHLAAKAGATAAAWDRITPSAVDAAAYAYKVGVLREARQDAAPGPKGKALLRRGGKKVGPNKWSGIPLNAVYDIKGRRNATAILKAKPQGPFKWLEYGTAPHPMVPGTPRKTQRFANVLQSLTGQAAPAQVIFAGRGRRRGPRGERAGQALRFENGSFRSFANHPGAPAKKTWSKGVAKAVPNATAAFQAAEFTGWSNVWVTVASKGVTANVRGGPRFGGSLGRGRGGGSFGVTRGGGATSGTPSRARTVTPLPRRPGT